MLIGDREEAFFVNGVDDVAIMVLLASECASRLDVWLALARRPRRQIHYHNVVILLNILLFVVPLVVTTVCMLLDVVGQGHACRVIVIPNGLLGGGEDHRLIVDVVVGVLATLITSAFVDICSY